MKQNLFLFFLFVIISYQTNIQAQLSFGKPELINNQWQFHLGDILDDSSANYDSNKWKTLDLPHDWSVKAQLSPTLASATGYLPGGIGWYRKTINIPQEKQNKKVYLYFEGVYNRSEVFLNGYSLGKRPNGYISFMYDATPYINFGKDNIITVRVDHSQYIDSRWYTGSGIYRNVWLVYADPVHVSQWGLYVYPEVKGSNGTLQVEVEVENGSASQAGLIVVNDLFDPTGKKTASNSRKLNVAAGQKNKVNIALNVKNPQLWDLEHPNLYTLKTTVLQNNKVIDETSVTTGFRTFIFDPDKGFALNGNRMKMKGVCLHHDAGVLGSAVPKEVWKGRLQTLKEIGINAIRTTHNPQAPDLYTLCDELGILVLDEAFDEWEFPKRKWVEGWNVGTPVFQGSYDFFEKWGEQDLADMVRRDRNHLSVFAWSIGNEVDYPNDPYSHPILDGNNKDFTQKLNGGYNKDAPDANRLGVIAKRLVAVVKQYDQSRPVTAGLAGVAMSNETEYPFVLDICGYNYTENRYISDHKKYPERVIFGSENRHDVEAWNAVKNNEHIFGQFLWTGIDYLGESGKWPSRGFYSGLMDFAGFIKPLGYFRKALWSDIPMAYIGTYPIQNDSQLLSMDAWPIWNYEDGRQIRIVCYTNAAKAKLVLNGIEVGQTKDYDINTGIIYWDIPYKAGKLEVIGLNSSEKEITRNVIQSSGQPYALQIVQADKQINQNNGLARIVVQVVDKAGIPVMISDNEVTCRISGSGKLLGLEAGNNTDMSDYTDNKQRVFHGRILAYVQSTDKAGEITVQFTSPWLEPAEITIKK